MAAAGPADEGKPPTAGQEGWQPVVGQHLYVAGTGKWWVGRPFGAVIVDIRDSDSTIKVRYIDGGFKRFDAKVLQTLATAQPGAPEMWEEWHTEPEEEQVSEMTQMHERIMRAVRGGDFLQADVLQKEFQAKMLERDAADDLRVRLIDAVKRGDYLKAHELQQQFSASPGRPPAASSASPAGASALEPPHGVRKDDMNATEILEYSAHRAFSGGLAGASAMLLQVTTLMWLRTTMNYQYRYGMSTREAIRTLYAQGGLARFYRGIGPAVVQGPLSRFADTAANAGVLAWFEGTEARTWPTWLKTVFASLSAATARVATIPVDSVKTLMQVEGRDGLTVLAKKYRGGGASVFYHGTVAIYGATFVSHYPWFMVFNTLNERIPEYQERHRKLMRNAGIGFCASVCSDTVSNSLRVLKTYRQTHETLSYSGIVSQVVAADGVAGLFGRGLKTRIITNGFSGLMFSVLYKMFEEQFVR